MTPFTGFWEKLLINSNYRDLFINSKVLLFESEEVYLKHVIKLSFHWKQNGIKMII